MFPNTHRPLLKKLQKTKNEKKKKNAENSTKKKEKTFLKLCQIINYFGIP